MTPRRNPGTELVPRSARATLAEIGSMSGALVVVAVTVVAMSINAFTLGPVLKWLSDAGKVLYLQLGWTLGIYVTVLVGFYAVSIGGQLIEGAAATARVRRTLGAVAELMASSTVPVLVIVGVYCWSDPPVSAVFLVLLPAIAIIFFLAVQLGAFVVGDIEAQIAEAASTMTWLRTRLASLSRRSSKPFLLVWPLNALVIAVIAVLISLPGIGIREVPLFIALHFAIALVLLGVNGWILYSHRVSSDRLGWFGWAFPGILYVVVGLAGVAASGATPPLVPVGIFFSLAATLVTTFWPRKRAARFVLDWSIQGAATAWAARFLDKKYLKVTDAHAALIAARPKPGLRERLVTLLSPH